MSEQQPPASAAPATTALAATAPPLVKAGLAATTPVPATILVVDDERNIRRTLRMVLEGEGHAVEEAGSAEEALSFLEQHLVDLMVLDVKLPGQDGLAVLERLRAGGGDAPEVIMISGHAALVDAVRATKLGAFDFLEKPLDRDRVLVSVRNALERRALGLRMSQLRAEVEGRFEMIGGSQVMQALYAQIARVAPTRGRVLITGESGTGKELVARAIHRASPLCDGPFVKLNCAAIPPELIESQLFGHERGAFTGAATRKRGLFEIAHGGTLFLDEIGDMSLPAQAKVLRVLQTGELLRVGGERVQRVEVRVLAATNQDLAAAVEQGRFRDDLYFRLNVVPLCVPPLRERLEDLPALVESFVGQCCAENALPRKRVAAEVLKRLATYSWPGNVRELRNVVERMVILSEESIGPGDVPPLSGPSLRLAGAAQPEAVGTAPTATAGMAGATGMIGAGGAGGALGMPRVATAVAGATGRLAGERRSTGAPPPAAGQVAGGPLPVAAPASGGGQTLREFREQAERDYILAKLEEHGWNISRTASVLGIERTHLHKKMRGYGITRGE